MRTFQVIHNIPSPYRIHLFATMHRELERRGLSFHVHFMSQGHGERPVSWRMTDMPFPHTFWREWWPTAGGRGYHFNLGMLAGLRRSPAPDFLLVGSAWSSPTGVLASLAAPRRIGIIWVEANTKTPGRIRGLMAAYKRFILRRFQYIAVPGQEGRGYLGLLYPRRRGGRPVPVALPNVVDESRFQPRAAHKPGDLAAMRREFGLNLEDRVAICPARLAPVKGLQEFLAAIRPEMLQEWKVLIVGEGPLAAALTEQIARQGYAGRVLVRPYVSYERMPSVYAMADLFLLPSVSDPNPLSVVEAMHSGLPLLLSDRVGNFPEALAEGINGWGFDPGLPDAVRRATASAVAASTEQLRGMGEMSRCRAHTSWNTDQVVRDFLDAVGAV